MARTRPPAGFESPWAAAAGLLVGAPAAALNQQLLAGALYWDCRAGGPAPGLLLSLLTAAATILAGWVSWRAADAPAGDPEARGARRFLAAVSIGSAGIFLFAIATMALASVLVPSCHR